MRSPRMMRVEKPRTTVCVADTPWRRPSASNTSRPDASACSTCRRTGAICSRRAARSSRIAISARTRPSLRVRRALMPCRSQTSSSASRLSNFSCCTASLASHSSFRRRNVCVVAGPRRQPAAIDLDDARREPLEERAIVRDEHDGAGIVGEERLEPRDGVDVEMVGRLVEQQQVGLAPPAPAPAATRRRQPPDSVSTMASAGRLSLREHQLDALLDAPSVPLFELVLQPAERLEAAGVASVGHEHRRVVILGHELAEARPALRRRRRRRGGRPTSGTSCSRRATRTPGCRQTDAGVRRQLPAQDAEQRRLAGAVPADDAHALARLDLQTTRRRGAAGVRRRLQYDRGRRAAP